MFRVGSNDFTKQNHVLLQQNDQTPIVLALLQLSQEYITQTSHFFKNEENMENNLLTLEITDGLLEINAKMFPYQMLFSLSQTYLVKLKRYVELKSRALKGNIMERPSRDLLSIEKIYKVIEDVEIKNLPLNHSLI